MILSLSLLDVGAANDEYIHLELGVSFIKFYINLEFQYYK